MSDDDELPWPFNPPDIRWWERPAWEKSADWCKERAEHHRAEGNHELAEQWEASAQRHIAAGDAELPSKKAPHDNRAW